MSLDLKMLKDTETILNFIENYQDIQTCKLFLANANNFNGLKKNTADFSLNNSFVTRWKKNDPYLYYTGLQIINSDVFNLLHEKIFSLNKLWDLLIADHNLQGQVSNSNIVHIGDINAYNQYND